MNSGFRTIQIVVFLVAVFCVANASSQQVEIQLKLREGDEAEFIIDIDESFEVVIENRSDKAITIPHPESREGFQALSFEINGSGDEAASQNAVVRELPLGIPVETNSFTTIEPSGSFSYYTSFSDNLWMASRWQFIPSPNGAAPLTIMGVWESQYWQTEDTSKDALALKIRSKPIQFKLQMDTEELPHRYLSYGFPDLAISMMKENPRLINKVDSASQTPLHAAAQHGHAEAVQWLIENKARIDSSSVNGFTPLSLTDDPATTKLLLNAGANPHHRHAQGTPLQNAARQAAKAHLTRSAPEIEKWNKVAMAYADSNVKFDLLSAIYVRDLKRVTQLLKDNPEVLSEFKTEQEPLQIAARFGYLELVELILDEYPDQSGFGERFSENSYAMDVVREAVPHIDVLAFFLNYGRENELSLKPSELLPVAVSTGSTESTKLLMSQLSFRAESSSESSDENKDAVRVGDALRAGIENGNEDQAIVILEHEKFAEIDQPLRQRILDKSLSSMCFLNSVQHSSSTTKLMQALVDAGANVAQKNDGLNLIQLLVKNGKFDSPKQIAEIRNLADVLVQANVEVDLPSAIRLEYDAIVAEHLRKDSTLVDSRGPKGFPILHQATRIGNRSVVEILLNAGADIELKNHSRDRGEFGEKPLHTAAFWGQHEIAKLLIDRGANVNPIARKSVTPLFLAAKRNDGEMIRLLLERGADPTLADINGRLPVQVCTKPELRKILESWKKPDNNANE